MQETKPNLIGQSREDLEQLAIECGEPHYRGRQIFHGIYGRRTTQIESLTDLSKGLRQRLAERGCIAYPLIRERAASQDGSVRALMEFDDGQAVESVFMPERDRVTLCISSQAGCAVDCRFCLTARMGLRRNLTAGEILGQVYALAQNNNLTPHTRLNIVFMGMGEPLLNYDAVMKTVRIMADPEGLAVPLRRITISTSGIIPRIQSLAREGVRPKLAVSLNASTSAQRAVLMPLERKYPLPELMEACRVYPLRPREKLTFEYVLLSGVNDSPEDAARVAALLAGMRAKVNLIPLNRGPGLSYLPPPFSRVLAFREILTGSGVDAFIRISRGQDVRAACGQLTLEKAV